MYANDTYLYTNDVLESRPVLETLGSGGEFTEKHAGSKLKFSKVEYLRLVIKRILSCKPQLPVQNEN